MRGQLVINFLLSLISFMSIGQEMKISGQLLDQKTNLGVPYAMIFNSTSEKEGTTSDENGFFTLVLKEDSQNHFISFSSLGYEVKHISVSQLDQLDLKVYLNPTTLSLPDFVIESLDTELRSYGDSTLPIKEIRENYNDHSFRYESLGKGYGVFVSPRKRDKGIFQSIEIYVTSEGKPFTPLAVRILKPKVKCPMEN